MNARLISGFMSVAVIGLLTFVPASVFAGTAAEAMNKLKEQSEIKAKSATASAKSENATENADAKEKAKKAVKGMMEKGKKVGN